MKSTRAVISGFVVVVVFAGSYVLYMSTAEAFTLPPTQVPLRSVYAAKFLCGEFFGIVNADGTLREGPVKPGNYQTAINVHNPHSKAVGFRKKAVLLFDSKKPSDEFEPPMPPGQLIDVDLESNWGLEIDCRDIRQELLQSSLPPDPTFSFINGFVVIEASGKVQLDVVAAYTSHGFVVDPLTNTRRPLGFSLDVETVSRKLVP